MSEELFELDQEYDAMLNQGIQISGESKQFFIEGRVSDLRKVLPAGFHPERILDFGCGIGDSSPYLMRAFPGASIYGVDSSKSSIAHAQRHFGSAQSSFGLMQEFTAVERFDLCYVNGVFHHILPENRPEVCHMIHRSLVNGGYFALFENNWWNPGTRLVMMRIPFDRDAKPLSPPVARNLLKQAGFDAIVCTRSLFYFPRALAALRRLEASFARIPLGAQYYVLARKTPH